MIMETEPGFAQSVVFRFAEIPAYESRFLIRLNKGVRDAAGNESSRSEVFHVSLGGMRSKPPALRGIRLPLAPGKNGMAAQMPRAFSLEDVFADLPVTGGEFPYNRAVPFWIELYFDTAPGASVDPFSVMELFRLESTNNALSFSPQGIRNEHFTWPVPRGGWESCSRLEIRGTLTNTTNSGVVSFRLGSGLQDDLGNRNEKAFRLSLLK
jgi:hypothetical protein